MANPSLQPIYNRMNGVSNYHPYTADTFADWSLEAGDIVTVSQDGKTYSSPVHATTLRWNGQQQMELESHGEKEREALAKMSAKAYNTGNGGGNGYRGGYSGSKKDNEYYTLIKNNEREIHLEAGYREDGELRLQTTINQTAERVEIAAKKYADEGDGVLEGKIEVQADLVGMVVQQTGDGGKIKAAAICAAIRDGGSEAYISADHIRLSGTTTINDIMQVGSGSIQFTKPIVVSSSGNSVIIGGTGMMVNSRHFDVTNVTVSGNTLTITYWDGSTQSFSKATSASGTWSGGIYTVTAKQGSAVMDTDTTTLFSGEVSNYTQWAGNTAFISIKAFTKSTSSLQDTGRTISLNCQEIWQAGYDAAPGETHTHHLSLTYNKTEELPSGTLRYHYYTTGSAIHTSGSKQVYW